MEKRIGPLTYARLGAGGRTVRVRRYATRSDLSEGLLDFEIDFDLLEIRELVRLAREASPNEWKGMIP